MLLLFGWRTVKSHIVALRDVSIGMIAAAWIYHLFPASILVELYVSFLETLLLAREVTRHYTFVATVAPMSLDRAWNEREAVCWKSLVGSLVLLPIAFGLAVPAYLPLMVLATILGWAILASVCVSNIDEYWIACRDAIKSWCSYNRNDHQLPGILVSPSGECRMRLTLMVGTVLLNVFVLFRLTHQVQLAMVADQFGHVFGPSHLPGLMLNLVLFVSLCAAFALIPVACVLLSICIIGTPVFGRLTLPEPSHVPASQWKEITNCIQQSENNDEKNSIYVGRIAFDQSPMLVPVKVFQEHAHFLGDSGSGKTARGLSPFIEQVIGKGDASLMVIDLKGDSPELLQTIKHGAAAAKTLHNIEVPIRYFTQRENHATYAFNPFRLACWDQLNNLQKTDILCGAMGLIYGSEYGQGYFSSANALVLYTTISNFPMVESFEELRDRVSHVVSSPKRYGLDEKSRDAGNHVKMSITRLASIAALNVTEDSAPNDRAFAERIDPTRLFERPEALYFSLSATLGPGVSPEIGRFAAYMLLTAATLTKREVPVFLIIDEFQRMASSNLDYLLQLARSMGVAVILANQSMEDLRSTGLMPTLETNCRYRQWFAISGWDDQDRLSRASGETIDTIDSVSVSESTNDRGATTGSGQSRQDFIAPRLTKNDIKLVSDDDRKSVVLINRGHGYAQFGGMPVVIESDFHISEDEYRARRDAPWPSTDDGTFAAADWDRPKPASPHKGRTKDTSPPISTET
ncbi:MAG: TraM recognition domain-containing protein, partial [Pirellulales bacterium]|nr:TraM recognition domain-containing protein [Pirellulales bacterium]